jgi:hypothetical protein
VDRPNTRRRSLSSGPRHPAPHRRQRQGSAAPDRQRVRPGPSCSGDATSSQPEPSTTEGRRIQGKLRDILEGAAVRQAESSASRRRADPSEHHAVSSRRIPEASVHPERMQDEAPATRDRLSNEHHHLDHRARLDEKVRRGYHPRRGGRCNSEEDRSPSLEPPGLRVFSRAIR